MFYIVICGDNQEVEGKEMLNIKYYNLSNGKYFNRRQGRHDR